MKTIVKICQRCGESNEDSKTCIRCGSERLHELTVEETATLEKAVDELWSAYYLADLWRKYVVHSDAFSPEEFQKMKNNMFQSKLTFETLLELNSNFHSPVYNADGSLNIEATRVSPPMKKEQPVAANTPKCPTCGSTNIHKMTAGDKAGSVLFLGVFSPKLRRQFKCDNCGYEW